MKLPHLNPRYVIALAILTVVCIMGCVQAHEAHADSFQLDALATQIAQVPVNVVCYPENDYFAGAVIFNDNVAEHTIYLQGTSCGALQNVLTPGLDDFKWLHTFDGNESVGWAFHDLVHEALHIQRNSQDEGDVECAAHRNDYRFTKLLGLTWQDRNNVYRAAERRHDSILNTEYRSVC